MSIWLRYATLFFQHKILQMVGYCNYDGRMTSPSANPSFTEKHSPNSGVPNPDAPGNSSVESRAKLKETTEIPRKRHLTDAKAKKKKTDRATKDHQKIGEPMGTPKGLLGCHGLWYHPTSRENHQPWRGPRWPRTDQTGSLARHCLSKDL